MSRSGPWKWSVIIGSLAALAAILIALAIANWPRVNVKVENVGPERLQAVVVYVTGNSYALGDIPSGMEASVDVEPSSESHVEVEFVNAGGTKKRIKADCYFEPGYKGTVAVKINSEGLVDLRHNVYPGINPFDKH